MTIDLRAPEKEKRRGVPAVIHKLRQPTGRRWAAAGVLIVVFFAWRMHHAKSLASKNAKKGMGAVPIAAAPAVNGDIPVYLDGLGSVTAYYNVTVRSRVDGQLMSIPVNEGQFVHKGDVLAEIDPRPFQAALDQASGQLAKDQALLDNAKVDLDRYRGLIAQEAIPKQQLDTQVATVAQDEGTVKTDQAAVEAAKLNITYSHITSPINGRVGLRLVDPGNMVHAADVNGLLVIAQLQPITVVFTLPEDSIPKVMQRFHTGGTLPVEAWNRDKTQKLASGKLLTADNQIDPNTGTLKFKAVFDNDENTLFPNQFVNARLLLETQKNQVIVPAVAIQRGSQGTFVFVVNSSTAGAVAEMRPVTVGTTEGNDTSVSSGVRAGEMIVVDGADKLQTGSLVMIQQPAVQKSSSTAVTSGDSDTTHKRHS